MTIKVISAHKKHSQQTLGKNKGCFSGLMMSHHTHHTQDLEIARNESFTCQSVMFTRCLLITVVVRGMPCVLVLCNTDPGIISAMLIRDNMIETWLGQSLALKLS